MILLHDAPEYVIGDMISPFKAVIGDAYKAVEARLLAAIHFRFGLPPRPGGEIERMIKTADRSAAFLEATRLAGFAATEALRFLRSAAQARAGDRARLPDPGGWTAEKRFLERLSPLPVRDAFE